MKKKPDEPVLVRIKNRLFVKLKNRMTSASNSGLSPRQIFQLATKAGFVRERHLKSEREEDFTA